jgi:aryl-alcohol dehydrogenase-like predicted oxidoreductase
MRYPDRLILGTANFHGYTRDSFGRHLVAPPQARSIIDFAISCGISGFDCADGYGFGQAEAVLGSYAAAIRAIGPMSATTKIGFNFYNRRYLPNGAFRPLFRTRPTTSRIPFDTGREFSERYVRFAVERSLHRLGGLSPNVLLHCPDVTEMRSAERRGVLNYLNRVNRIKRVGVSVKMPEEVIVASHLAGIDIVQFPLASLRIPAMRLAVQHIRRQGCTTMLNQPFGGGTLVTRCVKRLRNDFPEATEQTAGNLAAEAILHILHDRDLSDFIVVGVSSTDELQGIMEPHAQTEGCGRELAMAAMSAAASIVDGLLV